MATLPSIPALVAHIRAWVTQPMDIPKGFYRRHLDVIATMSDADIADAVRFAHTRRGAEMALVHRVRQTLLEVQL